MENLRSMLSAPLYRHFENLLSVYKEKGITYELSMKPIEEGFSSVYLLLFACSSLSFLVPLLFRFLISLLLSPLSDFSKAFISEYQTMQCYNPKFHDHLVSLIPGEGIRDEGRRGNNIGD